MSFLKNKIFVVASIFCGLALIMNISGTVKKNMIKEKNELELKPSGQEFHLENTGEHLTVMDSTSLENKIRFTSNGIQILF